MYSYCTIYNLLKTSNREGGVNLFEPNVSTSANINRLIVNQNLVSDLGFLYTGIKHGQNLSFKYNYIQGMIKMHSDIKEAFNTLFFERLLEILHNYLYISIHRIHLLICNNI